MKSILSLVLSILWIVPALAQDVEGSEDHPLINRYPDAEITWYDQNKYVEYSFASSPITGYRNIEEWIEVKGQITRIYYEIEKTKEEVSIRELYYDLREALNNAQMDILAEGLVDEPYKGKQIGGNQWMGLSLAKVNFPMGTPPQKFFAGTSSSGGTFAIASKLVSSSGITHLFIYGERHSNGVLCYLVDIVEEGEAETGKIALDPDYMRKAIEQFGSVSIYGIHFDFNSSTIKDNSNETLEQMASFLKENSTMKFYVVGHTDMIGTLEHNQNLSSSRAREVKKALTTKYGVSKDQLESSGVAFLAPKRTNKTEEGRAENRRVELVYRPK